MAYKRLRLRRMNRLIEYGYSRSEARQLTAMRTEYPDGTVRISSIILSRPYFRMMMNDRRRQYRQAKKEGKSDAQFRRDIQQQYVDRGWITEQGTPDYWAEFRYYYRRAIQLGTYKPPPEKRRPYDPSKPHKKKVGEQIDREHVRKQSAKYRAKAKTAPRPMTGDRSQWIEQLRKSMDEAKTPEQREQFANQIRRLGGTV